MIKENPMISEICIPATCREREPFSSKGAAALLLTFPMEAATSSGMCSIPTARPSGPTIIAKHAVRYPLPVQISYDNVHLDKLN